MATDIRVEYTDILALVATDVISCALDPATVGPSGEGTQAFDLVVKLNGTEIGRTSATVFIVPAGGGAGYQVNGVISSKSIKAIAVPKVTGGGGGGSDDGATASDSVTTRPASKSRLYRNGAGRPIS